MVFLFCSPQTDREKDPDYDSLPSQTSQSESSMLQVICRPEATNKEEAYTFHTVHSKHVCAPLCSDGLIIFGSFQQLKNLIDKNDFFSGASPRCLAVRFSLRF